MNPNDSGSANNGNGHLNVPGDEVPPPPYSETDVYSNSGSSRSHTASAASVAASATAAAVTPSHSFVDDAASSTADETIYTPPLTPCTSPGSGQPAASLYFDLRPAPQQDSSSDIIRMTLVHSIEVNDASRPDDFPYESDWTGRDVTALDWSTFINFLIPDHTTRQNEAVIHRKLLDEMRSEAGNTNDSTAQVEAQLNQIADARDPANPDSLRRRRDVEATVQQWNDGFFGPRGIQVRLEPLRTPSAQMPGTWEANFDQAPEAGQSTQTLQTAGRSAPAGCGSWGGFQIDDNGVRYGNSFVADQNGLRIGNLVMDQRGIRFQNDAAQGQQQQQQQPVADADRDVRGRAAYRYGGDEKVDHKRSSSASSSSSSSSSSSESSIGSLPSYDDIPVNSVQFYIARLQDWTKNPDQLRSKGDVKQLKAELKSIPKSQDVPTDVDKKALKAQIKTLTTVWKQVKKNQRRERKAQRKERRDKRKAERKEKRQHRKEMRKARKEARRGQSTPVPPVPPPGIPPVPPHVPGIAVPPVPPVPPANTSPWTGSFPWGRPQHGRGGRGGHHHHHHPHPHPHQQHYGLPRGGGWGAWNNPQTGNGRGSTGENGMFGSRGPFGPSGPFGPEGPFGPGGPFGEKGIFGGDGPFSPKGFFGPGQDEKHTQQLAEQQRQLAEQQRQQQQQQEDQQRQQADQQRQHYQQQAEQQRQQQQQLAEQQRQQYQQQAEQQRQHLQQQQQQLRQQYQQQRQGSASSAHSLPGSWPDEKKQQPASASQDDGQIPPPGPRASAKYQTVGALERTIQLQIAAAEKVEGLQKEQVEKAIATMKRQLESLRVQADEEYAKELSGN